MYLAKDTLKTIITPALLLDLDVFEDNLRDMGNFAHDHRITVRPHAKTLRSTQLMQRICSPQFPGYSGFTVAKLEHAQILISAGLRSIFVANMIVTDEQFQHAAVLAKIDPNLLCAVDNLEVAKRLGRFFADKNRQCNIMVKVNTGLNRCGLEPGDVVSFVRQLVQLPGLSFHGLYTHAGHAYKANPADIKSIGEQEGATLSALAGNLADEGLRHIKVSVGSTPTAKYCGAVPGVTEIRPGLFMVNDRVQIELGIAKPENCALVVLTTVISKPCQNRAYINGGSQTFSPDSGPHGTSIVRGYGLITNHVNLCFKSISEEHGWLSGWGVAGLQIGDNLQIIPNHACSTVNLHDKIIGIRHGEIEKIFVIDARGAIH